MRNWSDAEIEWLKQQLEREGIDNAEWRETLLDHICSAIENKRVQASIEEEFESVKQEFIHKEWNHINQTIKEQMENQKMKTVLRTLSGVAVISALFLVAGSILKIINGPGAAALLWAGVAVMGLIGGPILGYLLFKADQKKVDWLLLLLSTFFAIRFSYGVLARVQHWDNAAWIMLFSIGGFTLIYLPISFTNEWRKSETKFDVIWKHTLMLLVCVMLFTLFDLKAL
jgi:hypothetical protein